MKYIYIILILLFSTSWASAQKEFDKSSWERVIEQGTVKEVKDFTELSMGYLAVLSSDDKQTSLVSILRRSGDIANQIIFNNRKNSVFKSILATPDNHILLVGYTESTSVNNKSKNGWVVKITKSGIVVWEKVFGGKYDDELSDIVAMEDNYFLIAGYTESGTNRDGNAWAIKIDENGNKDWEKEFGQDDKEVVNKVIKIENNYLLAGQIKRGSKENAFILGLNASGEKLWREDFSDETNLLGGTSTFDDKAVLIGYKFNHTLERDVWALKINPTNGNIIWDESYGSQVGDDYGKAVLELMNGKLMLIGYSYSHSPGSSISKTWHLTVNEDDGSTKEKPSFFDKKNENATTVISFGKNRDILIGGMLDGNPMVMRFRTKIDTKPTITWNNKGDNDFLRVFKEGEHSTLDVSATITSPILLNKDEFKIYLNRSIQNNDKYYKNFTLSKPSISTDGKRNFIYTVENKLPIEKNDSVVELRLYNNLLSVRSEPLRFKMVRPFRLDVLWLDPVEANTSKLPRTVKNSNITVKMVVLSSEPLEKKDFHIVINGRRTEGAKYGETVMKPFSQQNNEVELDVHRYNYINNVYLQKGKNEIKLELRIDGKSYYSEPLYRNYYGKDPDLSEIKVDANYDPKLTNLHVLAIGVEHDDLKYTAQDALDMGKAFKSLANKGVFKSVNVETLTGKDATKTNIDIALERYKNMYRIGEINRNDLLVVFISSHGFIYKDSIAGKDRWIAFEKFMIQASNYDNAAQQATSVSYENIIANLAAIRCKKVIMLDACFSGGVRPKGDNSVGSIADNASINNIISQLSYQQPGLVTITSSTANQPSYESDQWPRLQSCCMSG